MSRRFENKVVVITGGAHGIGKAAAQCFLEEGARVAVIDAADGDHYVGDIGKKEVPEDITGLRVLLPILGHRIFRGLKSGLVKNPKTGILLTMYWVHFQRMTGSW